MVVEHEPKIYTTDDVQLLEAFRQILPELKRKDFTHDQMKVVEEEHYAIVHVCLDRGLVNEICDIRNLFDESLKKKK